MAWLFGSVSGGSAHIYTFGEVAFVNNMDLAAKLRR
jgi:hypothetical protein